MKRFYQDCGIGDMLPRRSQEVTLQELGAKWRVLLDGKARASLHLYRCLQVVKTPKGTILELPGAGVAHAVAGVSAIFWYVLEVPGRRVEPAGR